MSVLVLSLIIQYELEVFFFRFNKSFLNSLMIIPVGVTTRKKTNPITTGDITLPSSIPNLNQTRFSGVKILEFNNPNIKKIKDITIDQTLKLFPK